MKYDLEYLCEKKQRNSPISMLTAYDFPMAEMLDEAGVDSILIGDSVGTNVLGYSSEREVTMADMVHHTGAVARGTRKAFLIADLPFQSAENSQDAVNNSIQLLNAGAEAVKIEGWAEKIPVISSLAGRKITVCAHIGFNPQIYGPKPRIFGRNADEAKLLIDSAQLIETAGADLLIIEKVVEDVAAIITKKLKIPVIGIGSGRFCDGQVLVINDILGFSAKTYRHARKFLDFRSLAKKAIKEYITQVENGTFPAEENAHQ